MRHDLEWGDIKGGREGRGGAEERFIKESGGGKT